ncbi:MAG: 30S ribosomal protein S12 methylthiotransferase RimO [Gammaproteobacteria bacterium]|nr:30S ribosomal protein S12 methylthiotransferase RimO [Gammaproteobacteria bacterium]
MSNVIKSPSIGMVSLGCPKALVDSERIITQLRSEGYQISNQYDGADAVIVNTCGFIDSAKEESLEAISEALAQNGKVIVTGCMGVNSEDLEAIPREVLSISGPQDVDSVMNAVRRSVPIAHDPFIELLPPQGIKLTPKHYAYIKISEGCNHKCTFCIIPSMRGKLKSRQLHNVMEEAEKLAEAGVKELLVISQDTSAYGLDIKHESQLWRGKVYNNTMLDLCKAMGELGIWVRLHYVYPYPHVEDVIPLMADGKILPYIDAPFQHASYDVLKRMRRPASSDRTLEQIQRWRKLCPHLAIRSTFIVGFPGETDNDFEQLLTFLKQAELDRVGCFQYSPVEGAKSNQLDGQLAEEVKQERWHRLMQLQQEISENKLEEKVGLTLDVLIDEVTEEQAIGRSYADAPEIDGTVQIYSNKEIKVGEIVQVAIEEATEYDLIGSQV